jgi:putative methyltransferase (TIGR04325 family)
MIQATALLTHFARRITPPALADLARSVLPSQVRYEGIFGSWEEASLKAGTYENAEILDQVIGATERVIRGDAACDRDGATFPHPVPHPHLAAALLDAAVAHSGHLYVLDIGGALGSSYRQIRRYMTGVQRLRWVVVEQEHYVSVGRARFQTEELTFESSLEAAIRSYPFSIVVLSGLLQFVPDPMRIVDRVTESPIDRVVIDRTPFARSGRRLLTVQHVPARLGAASYPSWLFAERAFLEAWQQFVPVSTWTALERRIGFRSLTADFKGFYLVRKSAAAWLPKPGTTPSVAPSDTAGAAPLGTNAY